MKPTSSYCSGSILSGSLVGEGVGVTLFASTLPAGVCVGAMAGKSESNLIVQALNRMLNKISIINEYLFISYPSLSE